VVDARMGRGKTSAAVAYMSSCKGSKHFLYVTPYLDEVERICTLCDFEQPDSDKSSKLTQLKLLLSHRENIASTHALFYLMDDEALRLAREGNYCLIIDESVEMVSRINLCKQDFDYVISRLASVDDDGVLNWNEKEYPGRFCDIKEMSENRSLVVVDNSILCVMRPHVIKSFDEVVMMTYLFGGQYQKAYLDYFGFKYHMCGVDINDDNPKSIKFKFTDEPDAPPDIDYHELIHIVDDNRLNAIGDGRYALSKNWYSRRYRDDSDIRTLRNNLNTFFRRRCDCSSRQILWTCFKSEENKLLGKDKRFKSGFISLTARATNKYKDRDTVAYLANRFADPNVQKFFYDRGVTIDEDEFALGEMLQFIWRSCIRDNKPINVYVPSSRMRRLLVNWIDKVSGNLQSELNDKEEGDSNDVM